MRNTTRLCTTRTHYWLRTNAPHFVEIILSKKNLKNMAKINDVVCVCSSLKGGENGAFLREKG